MWVVIAYLIRRPARVVSRRLGDWLFAFGGTFGGVLFRPVVGSPPWGINAGLALQLVGLSICVWSFLALGRSFGFVAADRGLVRRGPYAVVRHPIYAS
jgi:protein-S-isoprenylcysteine O-methyltransferase Ste14